MHVKLQGCIVFLLVEFWFDSSISPCTTGLLNQLETLWLLSDPKMSASKEPVATSAGFTGWGNC